MHMKTTQPSRDFPNRLMAVWLGILLAATTAACASGADVPRHTPTPETSNQPSQAAAEAVPEATPTPVPHASAIEAPAATVEPRLELKPVATLVRPVFLTHAGDGSDRLYIVEQAGRILILENGVLLPEPFLDIRARVKDTGNEQGLLGLAFPPDYGRSLEFYVNYTAQGNQTVVSRFNVSPANPLLALEGSEEKLLTISQPATNHNGGMLLFGPDNMLWIGTGDGGAADDRFRNGQNPDSLLGKMLRIDVLGPRSRGYDIPDDNPWVDRDWNGRRVRDEVWAVGLRNPWRYAFDPATGDLWIADVGQNLYEDVHFVPAGSAGGLNFGWPLMEGAHCFPPGRTCDPTGLEQVVAEFPHGTGDCSVTGGYVYRGSDWPAMAGRYVVGDFCSGRVWTVVNAGSPADPDWQVRELADTEHNISSFGEDADGELYLLDLEGGVYRMEFPAN